MIAALVEGNSIRATCRMTGVAKGTVLKLLHDIGCMCAAYQDKALRNLPCKRLQCDEIWSFCGAKAKNVPEEKQGEFGIGDVWTWTAIDADTKLVPTFFIADRSAEAASLFMEDLAGRLANRVQLTTDGYKAYITGVYGAFANDIDFAMLVKLYGNQPGTAAEVRYSPAECVGCTTLNVFGKPDPEHVSTSYVERANLTMRMSMRRFTRLTNAFSKKVENLVHACSLHFMHYNFCRPHQSLSKDGKKVTPAMAAGVSDHVWSIEEVVNLLERREERELDRIPALSN